LRADTTTNFVSIDGSRELDRINHILTKSMLRSMYAIYSRAMLPIVEIDFTFFLAVLLGATVSLLLLNTGHWRQTASEKRSSASAPTNCPPKASADNNGSR
jgi:hypothetical protein